MTADGRVIKKFWEQSFIFVISSGSERLDFQDEFFYPPNEHAQNLFPQQQNVRINLSTDSAGKTLAEKAKI